MLRPLAFLLLLPLAVHASDFLDPNQAFRLGAQGTAPGKVELVFDIRPGHYMYREAFRLQTGSGTIVPLDTMPGGERKFDEAFQREMEIHRGNLRFKVELSEATPLLRVTGQGCADKGLCYAPMTSTLVANSNGGWSLQPGADPAGEFGVAPMATANAKAPQTRTPSPASLDILAALFLGLWGLLSASRRF